MKHPVPAAIALAAVAAAQAPLFEPRTIATIPEGLSLEPPPVTGPDGKVYSDRSRVVWSPDGTRVAYVAYRGGLSHAVIGDEVSDDGYHYMSPPTFSADGAHVVFRAGMRKSPKQELWWALLDGERGKSYDWIGEIAIGPDGTLAFWEQPGAKIQGDGAYDRGAQVLHFGKKKSKKYEDASSLTPPVFSAGGSCVASAAMKGGRWFVLTLDARGKQKTLPKRGHGMVQACALSPDGDRVAAVAGEGMPLPPGMPAPPGMQGAKLAVFVGNDELGGDADNVGCPVFAPQGKRLAFVFAKGDKMGVALDSDKRLDAAYDFVGPPAFAPDGERIAYSAFAGCRIDPGLRTMPWAIHRVEGGKARLVTRVAGKQPQPANQEFDAIASVTWSPDGERIAFAAKEGDAWRIVCGEQRSEPFDEVGPPQFDEASKRIAFGARRGRELLWQVLD